MDAFKVSEANLVVYIHPSKANNVSKAILHELSSMLFKTNHTSINWLGCEFRSVCTVTHGILVTTSMDAFKVSEANLVVYIHPSKANNVSKAILHELSSMLFKFSEVFDGVVLAYKKSTHSSDAKILPGIHPYFGVRLKAELLLFSPKPGMLLEGKVVKLGKESIHVVILDFCSACITEQDVREEFRYTIKHGEDVYVSKSHMRHVIKVGSMIRFSFKSMDEEILHIAGSLSPSNTGNIRWLEKHAEEGPESERSCKRKNENQGDIQMHDIRSFDGVACQIENNGLLSKSSKRRRSNEVS